MKKIGIVTISYGHNYGNKLQNYAMQEVYKKMGFEVETIKFLPNINIKKTKLIFKLNPIYILKRLYIKIKNRLTRKIRMENLEKRLLNFEKFNNNIKFTEEYNENNYKEKKYDYDYISVGSDQVWNAFFIDFSDFYLLEFLDLKNKIAYAPSFGTNIVPKNREIQFKNALNKFKGLSCREEAGANLIYNLIGKEVPVVVDPTMLLSHKEWANIASLPEELLGKKFILVYFLGEISFINNLKIKKYAKDNNCILINVLDECSDYYQCGPYQFLGLIKNSFAVFTDSFHSSLFSIIFKKNFYVFDRKGKQENMYSRINTLLNKFELSDRKFRGNFKNLLCTDYSHVEIILSNEKEKSCTFLKKCLELDEEKMSNE